MLRRSIPEGRARERLSVPQLLHPSLRQSAAKVWPLCGFGGRVPAGASGWQEKWAVNKAGSRQVPVARHVLDPVPLAGSCHCWLWGLRPGRGPGARQVPVGPSPLRCSRSPRLGHPHAGWEPGGRLAIPGEMQGGLETGAPLWGAGLPFSPPSSPARQPKLRLGVWHMAAAMGLSRVVVAGEWESKHLCAGLGAAASNGFDGAVVVCCLENLHSAPCPRGPRHRRPWRYLNITTEG